MTLGARPGREAVAQGTISGATTPPRRVGGRLACSRPTGAPEPDALPQPGNCSRTTQQFSCCVALISREQGLNDGVEPHCPKWNSQETSNIVTHTIGWKLAARLGQKSAWTSLAVARQSSLHLELKLTEDALLLVAQQGDFILRLASEQCAAPPDKTSDEDSAIQK